MPETSRHVHQAHRGFKHGDAGAFRADQCLRHIKAVLRQQALKIVAGHAPGDFGITRLNEVRVFVTKVFELLMNVPTTSSRRDQSRHFVLARLADGQAENI